MGRDQVHVQVEGASWRRRILIVLVLLLIALVPRLLLTQRALWFDERFTVMNTASISQAMTFSAKDVHPPLYLILVAAWRTIFPSTEFSLRLLSLIFGLASLVGILLLGRSIAGWRAGIAGFLIAALAPDHWFYSTELRPYAVLLAFSAFSIWSFLEAVKSGKVRHFAGFAAASVLNLYAHYFAVFLLLAQAVTFLIIVVRNSVGASWTASYRNRQIVLGLISFGAIVAAYAPWIGVLAGVVKQSVVEGKVVGVAVRAGPGVTWKLILKTFRAFLGWGILPILIQVILVGWAVANRRRRDPALLFAAVWILPFLILRMRTPAHVMHPKHFLFAYPLTVGMVAVGLDLVARWAASKGVKPGLAFLALIVAVGAAPLLPGQHPSYALHRTDWRAIVRETTADMKDGDRISFLNDSPTYAMFRYHSGEDLFRRHTYVAIAGESDEQRYAPFASGSDVWILKAGPMPTYLSTMPGQLTSIKTWHIYPVDVQLYRWVPQTAAGATHLGGRLP